MLLPAGPGTVDRGLGRRSGPDVQGAGRPGPVAALSLVASHAGGEACVCDISETFDLSQPTISHHLKVLRSAGLLDCERRGTWVYYWVIPSALQQLSAVLLTESGPAVPSETCASTEVPA